MEIKLKTTASRIIEDIKKQSLKLPEGTFEVIIKKGKTYSQNSAYNSFVNILARESGITPGQFKRDLKYELGLYSEEVIKGDKYLVFKASADFLKNDWTNVFFYLEETATFLNVQLPPFKEQAEK
jgi:hypothetical protein